LSADLFTLRQSLACRTVHHWDRLQADRLAIEAEEIGTIARLAAALWECNATVILDERQGDATIDGHHNLLALGPAIDDLDRCVAAASRAIQLNRGQRWVIGRAFRGGVTMGPMTMSQAVAAALGLAYHVEERLDPDGPRWVVVRWDGWAYPPIFTDEGEAEAMCLALQEAYIDGVRRGAQGAAP
jgi:hypothetical protein